MNAPDGNAPADLPGLDPEADELTIGQERVLELISFVVVNLVEHPDDVSVDIVRRDNRDVYRVKVHDDDLGKVIGKGGQTARALRVLLMAVSARTDQRLGLEIVE
ncbi:MAG: KH domain-containing protein [bacterium]|nr:KH domain-containing protein [bacterium]